jgi:hypothetical protein
MKKHLLYSIIAIALLSFPNTSFSQTPIIGPNLAEFTSVSALYTSYGAGAVVSNNVSSGQYFTLGATGTAGNLYANGYISLGAGAVAGTQTIGNTVLSAQLQEIANAKAALSALPVNFTPAAAAMGVAETLVPGVYHYASALGIPASAVITFDGGGAANPKWIFNVDSAIVVGASVTFNIINSGPSASVIWNSGMYLSFIGTIFAESYVTFGAGASLPCGNVFSRTGYTTFADSANFTSSNCIGGAATAPYTVIIAIADTTLPVDGLTGGNTPALTSNDLLGGAPVVIGTAPGNVVLTGVTVPAGMTLNTNGTVTIAPNTAAGNYNLTYKICEVTIPTNCSTVTSTIVVTAPATAGTLNCAKTQIIQAPVQGVTNQVTLVVTMNVTTAGNFPVTLSGSGMSLANGITYVTTTTAGVQTFNIPMKYDGTALGTLTFEVGSNTCTADLSLTKKKALIDIWTLDNCTIKIAAPTLN